MRSWIARPILAALVTALAQGVPLLRIPHRRYQPVIAGQVEAA
jgi:hypothetical protein